MLKLLHTHSEHPDFEKLVKPLNAYLAILDGEDHAFYAQFNQSALLKNTLVAYWDELPVGIGAYKAYDDVTAEIKRMYVEPAYRGKGIAVAILSELELWAKEEGFEKAILETGHQQFEAIQLYQKTGYHRMENYGQYAGVENSLCFQKSLK
ncbi:MAG: hypothetical protein RLZZ500_327 [Bacteroidota bacterium]|jgi:GNAT superfamily N-acetyltransferase